MTFSKLGTDSDTQQLVYLPKASRLQGFYIIGIQGTGKSGLIENLIMEDINQQIGVCVLDPHGELINNVLARLPGKTEEEKVSLLDIADYTSPSGLNLFECPDPTDDGEIVKTLYQVLHVFEKAYGIVPTTPLMYDLLYHTVYTLIANPGYTMIDIRLLLTNEACRKQLAANVPNDDIQDFWRIWDDPKQTSPTKQQEDRKTILNKMNDFLHVPLRNIVGQSKTTFDLEDVMNTGKILLVKLSRRLEQPSNLIGSIIIAQLLNAAYARPTNKRRQFHLYADEFQNFATEDFATLLEEARKFGIGTTIAHQNRGQLNSANSQLETDLKDRSRSVGNMVVFKINSKDAGELVGEFKITPQAAWEEEIEKEWYERKEEDVLDGTKPIKTPVKDVVHHLLNGGQHKSDVVNQFAVHTLSQIDAFAKNSRLSNSPINALNSLLFAAMVKSSSPIPLEFNVICLALEIELIGHAISLEPTTIQLYRPLLLEDVKACRNALQGLTKLVRKKIREWELEKITLEIDRLGDVYRNYIKQTYPAVAGGYPVDTWDYNRVQAGYLKTPPDKWLIEWKKQRELAKKIAASQGWDIDKIKPPGRFLSSRIESDGSWYHFDPELIEWRSEQRGLYGTYEEHPIPGQEYKFYREADLAPVVEKQVQVEFPIFEDFIWELREVMQALADDPIEVDSGLVQPNTRKHVTYLTHPRKVIMHPQRTYQDVQNELETQLVSLPNFSARVKIGVSASQNPGKKCLSCKLLNNSGALDCTGCGKELPAANEYILTTLKPASGLNTQQLEQRIKRIQVRNLQQKHLQDRKIVEAEITQRQTQCSGSSPTQPHQQPSPQQARHARQVPVQGKCPNCGKNNPSGSRF